MIHFSLCNNTAGNAINFKGVTKTYNSNNQQTGAGFTHDANGNPTTYKGTTLSFDVENRLTAHGGASLTAGYRGDGLRAWKETLAGRTYFLYDGTTPVVEMEASGALTATNTFGAHGLVSRYRNSFGSRIFYTFDAQGSVAQRLDLYGNVLTSRSYTAHGQMVGKGVADPFGYKAQWGYYTDTETGLLLLTHRYYDPSTGRFLTRDPIGYRGGINLYGYTKNNAINRADPRGLDDADYPITGSPAPNPWYWSHNESADNLEPIGPSGMFDLWTSVEGVAGVHLTTYGLSGATGVTANINTGEICGYVKGCSRIGFGVIGSVGPELGVSAFGPHCGRDLGNGVQFELAGELTSPAGGGSVTLGWMGGSTGIRPSWGLGFSLGLDICGTQVLRCWNTPPECRSCGN
ncbi:MAG: RHS repeat-associated core domain-containing protein [Acidobacteria bacterium]|nr:RHS repeat-associated core domain-containing protein [Acidobacteriota bacterium]